MVDTLLTTSLFDCLRTEVHVWYCQSSLLLDETRLSEYESLLSAPEIERYRRFKYEKDRQSYLVSHVLLRKSLSKYAELHASQWQFSNNAHGKPELKTPSMLPGIRFNLTHTDDLCACVITLNKSCGIDAENIHRKNRLKAVAQRMFAAEEVALLQDKDFERQFYNLWTLREAYVKALGTGLAGSSKDFYFEINSADLNVVMHHKKQKRDQQQRNEKDWNFSLSAPTVEHILAVAYESREDMRVQLNEYPLI